MTLPRLFFFTFLVSLSGCIEPTSGVFPSPSGVSTPVVGPHGPAPDQSAYQCSTSIGSSCKTPLGRFWMPGWIITSAAARGTKAAFIAYPTRPNGGADFVGPQRLGQIDLVTGNIDWLIPLANAQYDYYLTYDMTIAPNGDVIVAATGYGELLLGDKISEFDGFVASFNTFGQKRFAHRFEIRDAEPIGSQRPRFINAKIVADDIIRVQTAFQVTDPDQPTVVPIHIFAFTMEGALTYRQEVPIASGSFNGYAWSVEDGTIWVKTYPGPFRRYSKDAALLNTFDLSAQDIDIRGFAAMGSTFGLVNLTTKGMTNELHRFDVEKPLVPLFNEPTFPEFHASEIVHTVGFERTYFVELGYMGRSHRFARIDVNGARGPVISCENVNARYTLLDNGDAVLHRHTGELGAETGSEWIVQPL